MWQRQGRVGRMVLALSGGVLAGSLILAGCGAASTSGTAHAATTATAAQSATATLGATATTTATTTASATQTPPPTPTRTPAPRLTPTATPRPAPTPTPAPTTAHVSIVNVTGTTYGFSPGSITITRGSKVIWTNTTNAPHTVTSDAGDPAAFDSGSGLYTRNSTYSFTFTVPGTYHYHCTVHPYMTATIIVTA